jgi:hypothetical protein
MSPEFKIRKTGRTWKLYHRHRWNGDWHGPVAESSHWRNIVWVATGEPSYRMPGFIRLPAICYG